MTQLNRQARWHGDPDQEWRSYGNVTHVEAARRLVADEHELEGVELVETRDESSHTVFKHSVQTNYAVCVTPMREGA